MIEVKLVALSHFILSFRILYIVIAQCLLEVIVHAAFNLNGAIVVNNHDSIMRFSFLARIVSD